MGVILADINSSTINGKRTGHYYALARNYKEIFGKDCVIAGGPVYRDAFAENDLMVLPYNVVLGENSIIVRLKNFANARALFKQTEGQCVVLQQCATITTFLCILLFYHKKSRLFFIQYSLEGFRMKFGKLLYRLAKHKLDGIICPNDVVGQAYGIPYCVVPDYIYSGKPMEDASDNSISYNRKQYDFCIIGRIAPGKGCVESARKLANTPYKVLIAGNPQTEELSRELRDICDNADNITLRLGYVSDSEYNTYLSQSRYTIMNYQGEYSKRSSGVVYDTVFAGVPVVGCRCKALQFIEDNSIGYIYDNIEDFDPQVVMDEKLYKDYRNNIIKYCETHKLYKDKLKKFLGFKL